MDNQKSKSGAFTDLGLYETKFGKIAYLRFLPTLGRDLNLIRLTTKALAELADTQCLGESPYVDDDAAIVAYTDAACTVPVGFMAYYVRTTRNMAWLHLGYVVPDWRGEGLYRRLWQALIDKCVEENYTSIGGGTSINNHAMQAIMARLGRKAVSLTYEYDVKIPEVLL